MFTRILHKVDVNEDTRDQDIGPAPLEDAERGIRLPSLPPELWSLIFSHHTDPKHLWATGRRVCSTWRSEIPKVIAKKYLANPRMTQIHTSCSLAKDKNFACLLAPRLTFSRWDGETRAVFKPYPWITVHHRQDCRGQFISARNEGSRSIRSFQFGHTTRPLIGETCLEDAGGRRCDIPPYQIRIKWDKTDTELPALEVHFEKSEISFEWRRMLGLFYREIAILEKRDGEIAKESTQWLIQEKPGFSDVLQRALNDRRARWNHQKKVRRSRIERQYREVHGNNRCGFVNTADSKRLEKRIREGVYDFACAEGKEELQMRDNHERAMHDLTLMAEADKDKFLTLLGERPRLLFQLWEASIDDLQVERRSALEALRARQWLGRHGM